MLEMKACSAWNKNLTASSHQSGWWLNKTKRMHDSLKYSTWYLTKHFSYLCLFLRKQNIVKALIITRNFISFLLLMTLVSIFTRNFISFLLLMTLVSCSVQDLTQYWCAKTSWFSQLFADNKQWCFMDEINVQTHLPTKCN